MMCTEITEVYCDYCNKYINIVCVKMLGYCTTGITGRRYYTYRATGLKMLVDFFSCHDSTALSESGPPDC